MRFLDTLDLYLTESKEPYDLYPVDYDSEDGASFGVDIDDSDDSVAKIIIKSLDGTPVDALGGSYDYEDVYADIQIEGDTDDPKNLDLISWVVNKFIKLGYDENTIRIDGEKYSEYKSDTDPLSSEDTEDEPKDDYTDLWDSESESETDTDKDSESTDNFDIDTKLSNPELTNTEYELDGESHTDEIVDDSETTGYGGNFPKKKKIKDKK